MTFVPIMSHVPPPPSRRARELSEKIRVTIEEYRRFEPGTTGTDVRQALDLATAEADGGKPTAMIAVLIGVLLLGGLVSLFYFRSGGSVENVPMIAVVLGVIVVLAAAVALARARGR